MQKQILQKQREVCKMRYFYFLLVLFQLFLFGCQPAKKVISKEPERIPVKVMHVEPKDLTEVLDYAGDIKAKDEAVIFPKVSGKIIEKVKEDGSPIQKGEAILYLDRDEVGLKFEKAPVESTLSGLVGRVFVDIGEQVTPQTKVALVVSIDKVKVSVDIPEKHLSKIFLGQKAKIKVDTWPEEEFSGEITKISPVVDPASRSSLVEITVDNPGGKLKPGMFAKVKIILEVKKDALVILQEAIMGKDNGASVFVIEDDKAVLKNVVLGLRQGPYYEVKQGLKKGDLVVVMGQQKLFDGALVAKEVLENR